jgi:putative transposase
MIDRTHDLPISRQAKALSISRGSVYYLPRLPGQEGHKTFGRVLAVGPCR